MKATFLDRFFHSAKELTDVRQYEERDINTLFSFLENMHATRDKLKKHYSVDIADYPEFKFLKILRNYFHHVDDIDEFQVIRKTKQNMQFSHIEQIIVPVSIVAKSIKNFKDQNSKNSKRLKFVKREFKAIQSYIDCPDDLFKRPELYTENPKLKCDGTVVELGFDLFKSIYNISNIIADECRSIEDLRTSEMLKNLEAEYSAENNVPKLDISLPLGMECILTTEGHIFPKTIEKAI